MSEMPILTARQIEKTFENLYDRYIYYNENSLTELKKFEKELEFERKKKFTNDQKVETEKKKDSESHHEPPW